MKYLALCVCFAVFAGSMVEGERNHQPAARSRLRSSHHAHRRHLAEAEPLWTTWSRWTACSFTCGRGVRSRYRGCVQRTRRGLARQVDSRCPGKPRQYQMCEKQPCPLGSGSPREYQCAQKNEEKVLDKIYEWVPLHTGYNQCDLTCMATGYAFYNNFGHASDGTPCGTPKARSESPDDDRVERVCVNGTCLAVGCDGMVDSGTRLDKCRVCGGENANCYHFRNSFMILEPPAEEYGQYQDIVAIPEGATYVEVTDHSDNYLALADDKDTFILNGNWMIDWPGRYQIDDTVIKYERRSTAEILTIQGPTTRNLTLKLLFRERNPGVHYEFYIPSSKIDQITVPDPDEQQSKRPAYIPPLYRPPRYGTGNDITESGKDGPSKITSKDQAPVTSAAAVTTTAKPQTRGVEIPLARILDEDGNLVEAKHEKLNDEQPPPATSEAPPSGGEDKQGMPWYLRAHKSAEYDHLVQGGIPLAKPNQAGGLPLNAQPLQYGASQPYQWPSNNEYSYALYRSQHYPSPYGSLDPRRQINPDVLNPNPFDPIPALPNPAGPLLNNPYNRMPPGGDHLNLNWDQFNSYPYNQQRLLLNVLNTRTDPQTGRLLDRSLLPGELLTPGTTRQIQNNSRLSSLYPDASTLINQGAPYLSNSNYPLRFLPPRSTVVQDPDLSRRSHYPALGRGSVNTFTRQYNGHSSAGNPNWPLTTGYHVTSKPTAGPASRSLSYPDRQTAYRRPTGRSTPIVRANQGRTGQRTHYARTTQDINRYDEIRRYKVTLDPERGFIQPPLAVPTPPSYVHRSGGQVADERAPVVPEPGERDRTPTNARGYVLTGSRQSYLDYYRDQGRSGSVVRPLEAGPMITRTAFLDGYNDNTRPVRVMAHDSGAGLDKSGSFPARLRTATEDGHPEAYGHPPLVDKSIKRTLEITPEGERIILYDLTDLFEEDNKPEENSKDDLEPEPIDDEYIPEVKADDDKVDDDESDDNGVSDDDGDRISATTEGNQNVNKTESDLDEIMKRRRDEDIFDYINEIIENGDSQRRLVVAAEGEAANHRHAVTMETTTSGDSTASDNALSPEITTTVPRTTGRIYETGNTGRIYEAGNTERIYDAGNTERIYDTGSTERKSEAEAGTAESILDISTTERKYDVSTQPTEAVIFSVGRRHWRPENCPRCTKVKDILKGYCNSDVVLRVTVHGSRIIGEETRYRVTVVEVYKAHKEPFKDEFVWVTNKCRCPRLRKNADYVLMATLSKGRLLINSKSYTRKFRATVKRRLDKLKGHCPV